VPAPRPESRRPRGLAGCVLPRAITLALFPALHLGVRSSPRPAPGVDLVGVLGARLAIGGYLAFATPRGPAAEHSRVGVECVRRKEVVAARAMQQAGRNG
jgi:hypothetical protein